MPDQPDQFADMQFPRAGVDTSSAFFEQGQGTTPDALNVRTFEPATLRGRGGSRPGTSKYIAAQLPSGAHLVQHLNVIVDPQGGATLDQEGGAFADPSDAGPAYAWGTTQSSRIPSGGRTLRNGGNGFGMQKNKKKKKKITFVQSSSVQKTGAGGSLSTDLFSATVQVGDLLIACFAEFHPGSPRTFTLTDTLGTVYTQVQNILFSAGYCLMWYGVATASGTPTLTHSRTNFADAAFAGLQYSVPSTTALDNSSTNHFNGLTTALSTGSVPVASTGELVLGCFGTGSSFGGTVNTFTPGASFNLRESQTNRSAGYLLFVADQLDLAVATAVAGTLNIADQYTAIGASFKPG